MDRADDKGLELAWIACQLSLLPLATRTESGRHQLDGLSCNEIGWQPGVDRKAIELHMPKATTARRAGLARKKCRVTATV